MHTDLTHMGFVIAVDDGPTVYITGDTAATDILHTAARHRPDVMIVCINAGFRNLSHWQAAVCKGRRPNIDQARQVPVFIDPEELKVDLYACTRSVR